MYATDEERRHLQELGWVMTDKGFELTKFFPLASDADQGCARAVEWVRTLTPVWEGQKPGKLESVPPEHIFWAAVHNQRTPYELETGQRLVAKFEHRFQSPLAALAYATVENWGQK